jgi:serine/threonine-protein kinase
VYDFGEQDGQPYLVMRLMTGGSLKGRIRATPFSLRQIVPILQRVGAALEHAHQQGVVHRDLKPDNILFDQYGDAYLADFGIVHLSRSTLTITGGRIGTPTYMSPEQLQGEVVIDGRSDIYSLGIVLFEMLTGRPPYRADTPAHVMMKHLSEPIPPILEFKPDLPAGVEGIIRRALAKERDQRYGRAAELVAAVTQLVEPVAETPPPTVLSYPLEERDSGIDQPAGDGLTVLEIDLPAVQMSAAPSQPLSPVYAAASTADNVTALDAGHPPSKSKAAASQPLPRGERRSLRPVVIGAAAVIVVGVALLWGWSSGLFLRDGAASPVPEILTAAGSAEPVVSASPAITGAKPVSPAYQPVGIDDIVNSEMDFSTPPRGDVTWEGVNFRIGRQIFRSQASATPNNRFPTRVSLDLFIPRAYRVYLLLNSWNGFEQYSEQVIGQIIARCNDTPLPVRELQLGRDVREWYASDAVVSTAAQVQEAWSGVVASNPDLSGYIDMLTVELPATCQEGRLNGLEIVDTSTETANSLDPGLNLVAVTVEYDR